MTITRRWQAGFESNTTSSTSEFDSITGSGVTIQTTSAKTGTYGARVYGAASYGLVAIAATRQIRAGFHFKTTTSSSPTYGNNLWSCRSTSGELIALKGVTGNLLLVVGGTTQDTLVGFTPLSDHVHVGIDIKVDSSAGWAVVYVDGVQVLSYTGDTGNADIEVTRWGNDIVGATGAYGHFDDCFLDDTTGESAAAAVPDYRFEYITPNGNGNYSQATGSDGDSTDNYLLVDDNPHDSDTTYTEADAVDERDTYAMTTITIPAGWSVSALIAVAHAKKSDAGTDTEIAFTTRYSSTDQDGSAKDLPSAYGYVWERFTTKPGGGAWDQSAIDGVEVGWIGKGTF